MMRKMSRLILLLLTTLLVNVSTVAAQSSNFGAHLSGKAEVPAVDTKAQGQAIFQLNETGTVLSYTIIVANIENVTQAHIHCGSAGVNGPVVAFLYGFGPIVSPNGILAQGALTTANVIHRPDSAACPGGVANLSDLMSKISTGGAYVNVHTMDNPGGEIRGQIH